MRLPATQLRWRLEPRLRHTRVQLRLPQRPHEPLHRLEHRMFCHITENWRGGPW